MSKRIKKLISILPIGLVAFGTKVYAQAISGDQFKIPNPTIFNNLEDIINQLTKLIVPVFLLTFAAMLLYGAFQYLTARDNAEQVTSARKIMIAAIIGFVLAVLAPTIVNFIAGLIGVSGLGTV